MCFCLSGTRYIEPFLVGYFGGAKRPDESSHFFALNVGSVLSELENFPIQAANVSSVHHFPNTIAIRLSYFYECICCNASKM